MEFTLLCKPFSVNAYHYRDKRHKTQEARDWEANLLRLLEEHSKRLQELAEDYKRMGGCFYIAISAIYPPHIFYNKQRQISSRTLDVTNFEKPIVDVIFGQVMGVNDKVVVECLSRKAAGPFYAININLQFHAYVDSDTAFTGPASAYEDGTDDSSID